MERIGMARAPAKSAKRPTAGRRPAARASARRGSSTTAAKGGKDLVIVESPAKARTINRYLGSGYLVKASMGHVRDLPKRELGVDVAHGFAPAYEPLEGRKKILAELKKQAKSAGYVYLATDLDREGEAIAWHLAECLGVKEDRIRRVIFNEITREAIRQAFAQPRSIDMNKVNAQQARRILDRIVGYEISPLLWRKVSPGLSAGRVQSVAVRLIVQREREIDAFVPEEYWRVEAIFTEDLQVVGRLSKLWAEFRQQQDRKGNFPTLEAQQRFLAEHNAFRAELVKLNGQKFQADNVESALQIAKALGLVVEEVKKTEDPGATGAARSRLTVLGRIGPDAPGFAIRSLIQRESRTRPPAPFTTASMQQAAAVQLRFSASQTMRVAQQLYEGVEIPGEGSVGLITYMRTDSRRLSNEAVAQVRSFIKDRFGTECLPEKANVYSSANRAQEAHEAIRPSDVRLLPADLKDALSDAQFKLYDLIWKRFVACQMCPAIWKVTEADIVAEVPQQSGRLEATFKAIGRSLEFEGFMRVTGRPRNGDQTLPALAEGAAVAPMELSPTQHFTQPPPRYTEASLVKALEAEGIGRPSTYATIIQTIQNRGYVEQSQRAFSPTDLGIVVTDKLVKHFPRIMDIRFTAHMEDQLDSIEEAQSQWVSVLEEFYGPFSDNLKQAMENMVHAKAEQQPSEYTCPTCGKPMVYRFSKNGRYLACTGYPECRTTHPVDKEGRKRQQVLVDVACPKCSTALILRTGKFGPFLSCSRYPDCDGTVKLDKNGMIKQPTPPPLQVDCPCTRCGSPLNLRRSKRGPWLSCSKYPKCRGRVSWRTLTVQQQKELEAKLLEHERQNPQPVIKTLGGSAIGPQHKPQPMDQAATPDTSQGAPEDSQSP